MLGKPHLKILQRINSGATPSELSEELDYSVKHVSETLSQLEEIGLLTSERKVKSKFYKLTESSAVNQYRRLVNQHPYVDFPELLTPSCLNVVYYLDQERSGRNLAKMSRPSRATVYRVLKKLRNRGIVVEKNNARYVIRDEYEELVEFSQEVALLRYSSKQRTDFPGNRNHVIWNNDHEYIGLIREISGTSIKDVSTDWLPIKKESDGEYYLTGLEALESYDLKFLTTSGYHVFYTEGDLPQKRQTQNNPPDRDGDDATSQPGLSLEDIACHLTIIQGKSMNQRYTLLFMTKFRERFDEELLRKRALHYDIPEKIDSLLRYIDERSDLETKMNLPTWEEFVRLAEEYEVSI